MLLQHPLATRYPVAPPPTRPDRVMVRAGAGRARTLKVEYNKKVKEKVSEGVHELVQLLAESRGKAVGMQMGRDISGCWWGRLHAPEC